jgi:hypothetical protein
MTIRCPVCRVDNDAGPACRRCKADLAPLFELEVRRALSLRQAACAAANGDADAALRHAREAQQLRPGLDALECLAAGFLLRRDFLAALTCWRWCAEARGRACEPSGS